MDTVWWRNFGLSKMDHSRQCLYNIEQIVQHSEAHPSSWGSMNCYQNDYGWKSSVVKTTTKIHILSMIRLRSIIQIGKSSIAFRWGVGISLFCDKLLLTRINLMLVKGWSRRSLLRSWQTADFHDTPHIKNNRIIHFSVSSSQFEGNRFADKTFYFPQLVTAWH